MRPEDPNSKARSDADGPLGEERSRDAVREHLVAYLDGELEEPLRSRVAEFLERDETLAEEARDLRESWDLLDVDAVPEAPSGIVAEVVAMAAAEARGGGGSTGGSEGDSGRSFRAGPAIGWLLAASVLIAVGIGLSSWLGGGDRPGAEDPGDPGSLIVDGGPANLPGGGLDTLGGALEDPRDLDILEDLELLEALGDDVDFLALLETSDDGSVEVSVW